MYLIECTARQRAVFIDRPRFRVLPINHLYLATNHGKMKKTATVGLCLCLSLLTGRVCAQASRFNEKPIDPVIIAGIELVVVFGVLYFLLPKRPKDGSAEKRKGYGGLIVFGFILLAMMTTNPSLEDHRQAVLDELGRKIRQAKSADHSEDSWAEIGAQLGESFGKIVADRVVERDNYLLFSITTVHVGDAKKDIGFGIRKGLGTS